MVHRSQPARRRMRTIRSGLVTDRDVDARDGAGEGRPQGRRVEVRPRPATSALGRWRGRRRWRPAACWTRSRLRRPSSRRRRSCALAEASAASRETVSSVASTSPLVTVSPASTLTSVTRPDDAEVEVGLWARLDGAGRSDGGLVCAERGLGDRHLGGIGCGAREHPGAGAHHSDDGRDTDQGQATG